MRIATAAVLMLFSLGGCSREGGIDLIDAPPETRWRMITTPQDRNRLRDWRKAWMEALPKARAADPAAIAAEGPLFEPDQAMAGAMPPAGAYRCRTFKLGGQRPELRDFTAYPWFDCRIAGDGEVPTLARLNGTQRPSGKLYAESDARAIFLGALELGDETVALPYGQDAKRDVAGYVERVGTARWRLVMPRPSFESQLDIIELIPAR